MKETAKALTLAAMLATVAWFFWNPVGWVFQWEPIVVFLFSLAGFVAAEMADGNAASKQETVPPNDVALFKEFLVTLPNESFIEFLKQHDFLGEFELESVDPLRKFLHEWENADHEFQNEELEAERLRLLEAANDLSHKISKYTSLNMAGWQAVRVDRLKGEEEHERRFEREAKLINESADNFVEIHQGLVRAGRRLCDLGEKNI